MLGSLFKFTEKSLATQIIKSAKKHAYNGSYASDKSEVTLRHTRDDGSFTLNLTNLFLKFDAMPSGERNKAIDAFVSEIIAQKDGPSTESAIESLAFRVRSNFEMQLREKLSLLHNNQYNAPVIYGEPPQALLELIVDGDNTIAVIDSNKLARLELNAVEAYKRALQNLECASQASPWQEVADQIWQSDYQDDYDFARLVAPVSTLSYPFSGAPIVFAPSHSICLITDNDSASTLSAMVEMGNQLAASHRPLSQSLWHQNHQGNWEPWVAPSDHAAFNVSELQRYLELSNCYDEQKSYLNSALDAAQKDIFVASYQLFEKNKKVESLCTYTLGVSSYLPKTDTVAVVDINRGEENSLVGMLNWDTFASIMGATQLVHIDNEVPDRFATIDVSKTSEKALVAACE